TVAQVFDAQAADWSDAKQQTRNVTQGGIKVKATIPAGSPWCMFVYPPVGDTYRGFANLPPPRPLSPWGGGNVPQPQVILRWSSSPESTAGTTPGVSYEAQ